MEKGFNNKDEGAKGFARLSVEERKKIAAKGGKASSADSERMREIGRAGGIRSGKVRGGKE
jgi:general stress protein YciG